jgi:hypothetical protein
MMSVKPPVKKRFKPLGEKLVDAGLITPEKLQVALAEQKRTFSILKAHVASLFSVYVGKTSPTVAPKRTALLQRKGLN